ncbi:amidohydrolase family protein [Marimonas sp. MJW-29]|uniref:Amidohydrolase family protein n=1 Tax=Sulfitobacter sediminis TaxID=3234186 RepID=A0ABV3RN15_9RHOB
MFEYDLVEYFDSLVHATSDGLWLGGDRYDASIKRLLQEMDKAEVRRACLVAIADFAESADVYQFWQGYPDRFVPIGSMNPGRAEDPQAATRAVYALAEQGFQGLKLHSRLNEYHPLDPRALAAIQAAGAVGMVVFLDTLFRQRRHATAPAADIIDRIALACPGTQVVLLHGGASEMLQVFEIVRMHAHLILDLSFTLLRYGGSSLEKDMRFVCENLDQRVTVGSDFPEYTQQEMIEMFESITDGLPEDKLNRIRHDNLAELFS